MAHGVEGAREEHEVPRRNAPRSLGGAHALQSLVQLALHAVPQSLRASARVAALVRPVLDHRGHPRARRRLASSSCPLMGLAYFPRTDPGQFVINLKAATGTKHRGDKRGSLQPRGGRRAASEVAPGDLRIIASNLGINPDISALFNSNSSTYTAMVQVGLTDGSQAPAATRTWTRCAPRSIARGAGGQHLFPVRRPR